jgi:hypothetical protein
VLVFFTNTLAPGIGVTQLMFRFLQPFPPPQKIFPPVLVFFTNTLALDFGVTQLISHPIPHISKIFSSK